MSYSPTPSVSVAKLIGALCGIAIRSRKIIFRFSLFAAIIPALFVCNVARAQVTGMAAPTPTIGATSPLGIGAGSAVSPTGIPLGSTEIASPGISPAPTGVTGTISMPSTGTICSTIGTSPTEMYGSTATYDGGGMTMGTATPASGATSGTTATSGMSTSPGISTSSGMLETSGLSGMCGSGSSSIASSSAPTSTTPTTPGGAARTGIPLGSTEIGNLGVSSAAAVPMVSVLPSVLMVEPAPTIPTVTSPPAVSSSSTPTSLFPCLTGGTSSAASGC